MGFKVFDKCCKNCLLTEDSIVSPERRKSLLDDIAKKQSFFVCHKATMKGDSVCCRKFYDTLGHVSQTIRLAERLRVVEIVEQVDFEKLPTHKEMESDDN